MSDLLQRVKARNFGLEDEVRYLHALCKHHGIQPDPWCLTPHMRIILRELCLAEGDFVSTEKLLWAAAMPTTVSKGTLISNQISKLRKQMAAYGTEIEIEHKQHRPAGYRITKGLLAAQVGMGVRKPEDTE